MENTNVRKTLRFTRDASATGAAIGSMPVVFIVAQGAAINYTGLKWLSVIIGVLTVALFAAVVEYGMRVYFPYGINGILSGRAFREGWRTSALFIIITSLGLAMMYSSGYMSFEGRKEAANLVAGETNTADLDQVAANVGQSEKEVLRIARSEKAIAAKAIEERKADIKRANANLVQLEQSGNAWAKNKLQKIIDTDRKLQNLEADLQRKSEAVTTLLSGSSVSKAVETVAAENALKLDVWKQRNQTGRALVGLFGIASILIFAFSAVTLELFDIVEGSSVATVKHPPTPPGDIIPVSGASVTLERKVDAALKNTYDNRTEIEEIKRSKPSDKRPEPSGKNGTDKRPGTAAVATVRACKQCGTDISHKRSDAKYCTAKCRKTYHDQKNG